MSAFRPLRAAALLAGIAVSAAVLSQDGLMEPEYVGNVVALQAETAIPLEKQRASNRSRGGLLKARAANEVEGVASAVRLAGPPFRFIVRVESNAIDPSQVVSVFRLDSNERRNVRLIETGSQGLIAGRSMDIDFLLFSSERFGESSYLITIDGALQPGEYAMTLEGSRDVFNMFGVD